MNYNGYGEEQPGYLGSTEPSYLDNSYGDYGASREVDDGEWRYQQYDDGRIKIIGAPHGSDAVGNTYRRGSIWEAITNKIGPYPSAAPTGASDPERYGEGGGAAQIVAGLGRGLGLQSFFTPSGMESPPAAAPGSTGREVTGNGNGAPGGMPTWAKVTLGVGGVALLGGIIYAVGKKK